MLDTRNCPKADVAEPDNGMVESSGYHKSSETNQSDAVVAWDPWLQLTSRLDGAV